MAFWTDTDSDAAADVAEPKRKFRFKVTFGGISDSGNQSVAWWAKTAAKPSFTVASAEHKFLNHTFYYPGSVTWNEVAVTLVDPGGDNDTTATFSDIMEGAGYVIPTNATEEAQLATISKAGATKALGFVTVDQLSAEGKVIETWTLQNAWISDIKYGDLEYGSDDLVEISLTFKYDWATLGDAGTSIATEGGGNTEYFKV